MAIAWPCSGGEAKVFGNSSYAHQFARCCDSLMLRETLEGLGADVGPTLGKLGPNSFMVAPSYFFAGHVITLTLVLRLHTRSASE